MDPVVLSYHDSLLHRSDLDLLNDGNWLNDRIIGFLYEFFENERFDSNNLLFVNPSTVQYLKLCESLDEARMCFLDPLEMDQKDAVFFPLNNNQSISAGGSHWSLLVMLRSNRSMVHFDSTGSNENEARMFFNKYKAYFQANKFTSDVKFPKQTNSSDCGVYLLAGTELIAKQIFDQSFNMGNLDFHEIDPKYIRNYRQMLKDLIKSKKSD